MYAWWVFIVLIYERLHVRFVPQTVVVMKFLDWVFTVEDFISIFVDNLEVRRTCLVWVFNIVLAAIVWRKNGKSPWVELTRKTVLEDLQLGMFVLAYTSLVEKVLVQVDCFDIIRVHYFELSVHRKWGDRCLSRHGRCWEAVVCLLCGHPEAWGCLWTGWRFAALDDYNRLFALFISKWALLDHFLELSFVWINERGPPRTPTGWVH